MPYHPSGRVNNTGVAVTGDDYWIFAILDDELNYRLLEMGFVAYQQKCTRIKMFKTCNMYKRVFCFP